MSANPTQPVPQPAVPSPPPQPTPAVPSPRAQPTPQDAPAHEWRRATQDPVQPPPDAPVQPAAPSGPNRGLVGLGLVLLLVAGAVAGQQLGLSPDGSGAPGKLIGAGVLLALVGLVGTLRRRRQ